MDRLSKILLVPTAIGTLAGLGLGQMTNVLQPYWPEAPRWVFAALFWSGAALTFVPLPSWLIWLAYKNRKNVSGRLQMLFGLALVIGGCVICVVGLSIIAAGEASVPAPRSVVSTTPAQSPAAGEAAPFMCEFPGTQDLRPDDPYVLTTNIGVAGDVIDNFISSRSVRFKLTNRTKTTARNVEAYAIRAAYTEGLSFDFKIRLARVSSSNANLRPNESDYFQLVEFLDPLWGGPLALTKLVTRENLESVKWLIQPNLMSTVPVGVSIPTLEAAQYRINRPVTDTIINIDIEIYADDLPVTLARFTLTDPQKIKVQLVAQGLKLPDLKLYEAKP